MQWLGPAGGLAWLVLIGLIIVGVVVLVVMLTRQKAGTGAYAQTVAAVAPADPYANALAVAADRYAKGEITKDQFEEIRNTLGAALQPTPLAPPGA